MSELLAAGIRGSEIERHYRHAYAFAAAYSTGVMMPTGFEYGWSRSLDVVGRRDDGLEPKRFDLSEFIAEVNAMKKAIPALNEEGPQRLLTNQDDSLVVLERQTEGREERAFIFVNTNEHVSREIVLETLLDASDSGISLTELSPGHGGIVGTRLAVEPLGVRVLRACRSSVERPVGHHPL